MIAEFCYEEEKEVVEFRAKTLPDFYRYVGNFWIIHTVNMSKRSKQRFAC